METNDNIDYLRTADLTVEEVRACAAFRHLSEDEAKQVVEALKTFTKIVYDHYKNQRPAL